MYWPLFQCLCLFPHRCNSVCVCTVFHAVGLIDHFSHVWQFFIRADFDRHCFIVPFGIGMFWHSSIIRHTWNSETTDSGSSLQFYSSLFLDSTRFDVWVRLGHGIWLRVTNCEPCAMSLVLDAYFWLLPVTCWTTDLFFFLIEENVQYHIQLEIPEIGRSLFGSLN